ncbi:MAG: hypothetical protein V4538_09080 [Bacteroidota bacterium]
MAGIVSLVYLVKKLGYAMGDNIIHYSNGIEASKRDGMFLGYYKPIQDSIVLDSLVLKTENIWYEKNWTTHHNFLFQKSIKVNSGIHIIAPYFSLLSSDLKVDIFIKQNNPDCSPCYYDIEKHKGLGYAYYINDIPDTLVLLFGTDNGFGSKDSVIYIRE